MTESDHYLHVLPVLAGAVAVFATAGPYWLLLAAIPLQVIVLVIAVHAVLGAYRQYSQEVERARNEYKTKRS